MANFIDDDLVEHAFLKGVPKLSEDLRFSFRPAKVEERSEILEATSKLDRRDAERRSAAFVKDKLVSWDATNNGQPVPITTENLRRLRPVVFHRVLSIVLGVEAWDDDPRANEQMPS